MSGELDDEDDDELSVLRPTAIEDAKVFQEELSPSPSTKAPRRWSLLRSPSSRFSIGSFDYNPHLLPIAPTHGHHDGTNSTLAPSRAEGVEAGTIERTLGLAEGLALVVGLQIGSGIFASPGPVAGNSGSPGMALIIWTFSGLLAWTGAASYAELGAAIPLNGGAAMYLLFAFGKLASFLYSWTAVTALKPGSAAIISIVTAEYLNRLFYRTAFLDQSPEDAAKEIPRWSVILVALFVNCLVAAINALSSKVSAKGQIIFTSLKVATLLLILALGFVAIGLGRLSPALSYNLFEGTSTDLSAYALALYSGLWAFDGWDNVNYVSAEMKRPEKHIPLVVHTSMPTVLLGYLVANIAYYIVLSREEVSAASSIALDFGKKLFGPLGGVLFAVLVAFSCLGALNATTFTASRLVFSAAREGYLPDYFGQLNTARATPARAVCLHAFLTSLMIVLGGDFSSLVNFYGVAAWIGYFVTCLGLIVLRITDPGLERPYRVWLATPIVFCTVATFLVFEPAFAAPIEALAALVFIVAGVPIYFIVSATKKTKRTKRVVPSSRWNGDRSASGWIEIFFSYFGRKPKHAHGNGSSNGESTDEHFHRYDPVEM